MIHEHWVACTLHLLSKVILQLIKILTLQMLIQQKGQMNDNN